MPDNALERAAEYQINLEANAEVSKRALQGLGSQIVELNFQRNQVYEKNAEAWLLQNERNHLSGSSFTFTLCDEYWDLLEMGTSIIAHING